MKRAFFTTATLAAILVPRAVRGTDPFEQKLSPDQEIVHALNRLTFGPRPGDADQVRRNGAREVDGAAAPSGTDRREPGSGGAAEDFGNNRAAARRSDCEVLAEPEHDDDECARRSLPGPQ